MKAIKYLIYRCGANAANQGMRAKMPVAIVTAASAAEAVAVEPREISIHAPARLALDPSVDIWANQHCTAIPVSRASRVDLREYEENWTMSQ